MNSLAYIQFQSHQGMQAILTVLVVFACALPWGHGVMARLGGLAARIARRSGASIATVFIISMLVTGLLAVRRGLPLAYVHDEFSYMLAADTFAHGRLTNPTPPAADHFESEHILVRPTYMSKYPPGQGLAMALGKVLFGHEIWGVWLSTAAAAAATAWALRAVLPARWALLGGLMMAIHPQMLEWGQRYWGGSVGVLGGALLLGGAMRLIRRPAGMPLLRHSSADLAAAPAFAEYPIGGESGRADDPPATMIDSVEGAPADIDQAIEIEDAESPAVAFEPSTQHTAGAPAWPRAGDAFWTAVGMLIVGNSRPFEGLVLAVLLMGVLAIQVLRGRGPSFALLVRRVALPMIVILAAGAIWMGYYNWRITGHPLRMPYQEHQAQYAVVPLFIFQGRSPEPTYNFLQLHQFYVTEQGYWYLRRESWYKLWEEAQKNIVRLYEGCLGNVSVLALPLVLLPWLAWKRREARLLLAILLLFIAALLTETYMFPHYAAPAAGVVAAIDLICLRRLYRGHGALGRLLARATVGVFVLWSAFWWIGFFNWRTGPDEWQVRRDWIANSYLAKFPGKHLIIVRYGDHNVHQEWVYNGADIPSEKVIWAREAQERGGEYGFLRTPDRERNRKLLEAYKDRTAWLLEPDKEKPLPVPYVLPGGASR